MQNGVAFIVIALIATLFGRAVPAANAAGMAKIMSRTFSALSIVSLL